MLFSATSTSKTEDLIKLALKNEPMCVGIEDKADDVPATVSGLEQGYVICPSEKRLLLLFTFLKEYKFIDSLRQSCNHIILCFALITIFSPLCVQKQYRN